MIGKIVIKHGRKYIASNNGFSRRPNCQQMASYILMAFLIYTMYGLILANLKDQFSKVISFILFTISLIFTVIFSFICSFIDPTDSSTKSFLEKVLNEEYCVVQEKAYFCHFCNCFVDSQVKHCRHCDRCVKKFDHHCKWINNCIGHENYSYFLCLIISCFFKMGIYLVSGCMLLGEAINQHVILQIYTIAVITFGIILSLIFFVLLFNLICLHVFLGCKGMTTYEYIVSLRNKSIQHQIENQNRNKPNQNANANTNTNASGIKREMYKRNGAKERVQQKRLNVTTSIEDHFKFKDMLQDKQTDVDQISSNNKKDKMDFKVNFYKTQTNKTKSPCNYDNNEKQSDFNGKQFVKNEQLEKIKSKVIQITPHEKVSCQQQKQQEEEQKQDDQYQQEHQQQEQQRTQESQSHVQQKSLRVSHKAVCDKTIKKENQSKLSKLSQYLMEQLVDKDAVDYPENDLKPPKRVVNRDRKFVKSCISNLYVQEQKNHRYTISQNDQIDSLFSANENDLMKADNIALMLSKSPKCKEENQHPNVGYIQFDLDEENKKDFVSVGIHTSEQTPKLSIIERENGQFKQQQQHQEGQDNDEFQQNLKLDKITNDLHQIFTEVNSNENQLQNQMLQKEDNTLGNINNENNEIIQFNISEQEQDESLDNQL